MAASSTPTSAARSWRYGPMARRPSSSRRQHDGTRHFPLTWCRTAARCCSRKSQATSTTHASLALSFDDHRTHTLVSGGAMTPQYADGYLFYCRPDGTLMAAPFDAARVELTGEARALPDRVDRSRFGVAHYAAAPGVLLYAPYAQTRLVEMDAKGAVTALTEEGQVAHAAILARRDAHCARSHHGAGADRDVWTLSRTDKTPSRVTRIGERTIRPGCRRKGGIVSKLQIARGSVDDRGGGRER